MRDYSSLQLYCYYIYTVSRYTALDGRRLYILFMIEVAIGPVTGSVSCGYRSGSLIYDTLRMSTRRFVDLKI